MGIAGTDGNLIEVKNIYFYEKSKKVDLGYVGNPVQLNTKLLKIFYLLE